MTGATLPRTTVFPGEGMVCRRGAGFLVVLPGGGDAAVDALFSTFEEACGGVGAQSGLALVRAMTRVIADSEPDAVPPLAAGALTADGVAVLVHGPVELLAEGARETRLRGADSLTGEDRLLRFPLRRIVVAGAVTDAHASPSDGRLDLRVGVVPGGGLSLEWDAPAAQADVEHEPEDVRTGTLAVVSADDELKPPPPRAPGPEEAADDVEVEVLDLGALDIERLSPLPLADSVPDDDEAPEDAVLVDGIVCRNNHFNHPGALYCAQCGAHMAHVTQVTVRRPRPSLGVVVLDDGTTFSLDAPYVVGRTPETSDLVRTGTARPLQLAEDNVSRVHAAIELDDWDVIVRDLDSSNGTFVSTPQAPQWARLPSRQPVRLEPGMRLAFGSRVIVFQTHHQIGA